MLIFFDKFLCCQLLRFKLSKHKVKWVLEEKFCDSSFTNRLLNIDSFENYNKLSLSQA